MLYSLLKLRQACNHPWLVTGIPKGITDALKASEQQPAGKSSSSSANGSYGSSSGTTNAGATATTAEVAAAKKLPAQERKQLLTLVTHPQSPCPVCMDVPEDPVASRCGHVYCRQCVAGQLEGAGGCGIETMIVHGCDSTYIRGWQHNRPYYRTWTGGRCRMLASLQCFGLVGMKFRRGGSTYKAPTCC
jgi:hypothetical protein